MIFPLEKRQIIRGFQDHINAGLKGATDYVANIGTPIYSPFYGKIYHFSESEGGTWLGIEREDGYKFEFAHLSEYKLPEGAECKPGDLIALSGNSGTLTTEPHVHHQILKEGERIDPEAFYSPTSIPIIAINGGLPFLNTLQAKILEYSQGMLTISWDMPIFGIPTYPTQDQAYDLLDKFLEQYPTQYSPNRYFFLFSGGSNAFLQTYYYPKHDCTISVIPRFGYNAESVAFEFSHAITQYYNEHRGQNSQIQDTDSNFPSTQFTIAKYRSILPYTDILI